MLRNGLGIRPYYSRSMVKKIRNGLGIHPYYSRSMIKKKMEQTIKIFNTIKFFTQIILMWKFQFTVMYVNWYLSAIMWSLTLVMVLAKPCIVGVGPAVCQVTWSMYRAGGLCRASHSRWQAGCAELVVWIFFCPLKASVRHDYPACASAKGLSNQFCPSVSLSVCQSVCPVKNFEI